MVPGVDPYAPTDSTYECPQCGSRPDADAATSCPDCDATLRNIAVPRE